MKNANMRRKVNQLGRRGEKLAGKLLEDCGMTILAENYRCDSGELDIVALDGAEIVFAEVKTLRYKAGRIPAANLSARQRRRNRKAALFYLRSVTGKLHKARFDLIEVILKNNLLHSITRTEDYLPPVTPGFELSR